MNDLMAGLVALIVAVSASNVRAQHAVFAYDPSLGTLPSSQGWKPNVQAGTLSVADGFMDLDTSLSSSWLYYFSPTALSAGHLWSDGIDLEVSIRVISSEFTFNSSNQPRFGFYPVTFVDAEQHMFQLALGEDRVALISDGNGTRLEHFMDTTDAVHTYRLCSNENGGRLFVDGRFCGFVPYINSGFTNESFWWADGSSGASSHTQLSNYRLVFEPEAGTCPVSCDLVDLNNDGFLDSGDINAFVMLFLAGDILADMNNDGFIDNGDIGVFVSLFLAGCP